MSRSAAGRKSAASASPADHGRPPTGARARGSRANEPPASLLDRRLLLVTGKGGVGKSTVAAALAWLASTSGKRVLACEFDAKGDLAVCLAGAGGVVGPPTGFQPREIHPRLWAMSMDPEASLREYLKLQLHLPLVTRIGALSNVFDFVASAAPGVREIVTVGKIAYEVKQRHWDLVVVDATASGHIVGQLRAPQAINELVGVGAIRNQTSWILDILDDPATTGLVVVATPEEMPVNETIELCRRVEQDTGVDLAAVVVNRLLPEPFNRPEQLAFEQLDTPRGRARLIDTVGSEAADALLEGTRLAVGLRRRQADHLGELVAALGPTVPSVLVPQLFDVERGLVTTRAVAERLAEELSL
jgi:anion-transporting  ArsA/GET3 family ATPase